MFAAAAWAAERGLTPVDKSWDIEIRLEIAPRQATLEVDEGATRFELLIYAEEWGFRFAHAGRTSWIRVTDIAFVHGSDDHRLLELTPRLQDIASLVRELENRHALQFLRDHATIRSTIPNAELAIRSWLTTL